MAADKRVEALEGEAGLLVEQGPLHLVIKAFRDGRLDNGLASGVSDYAFSCLEELAAEYRFLQQPHPRLAYMPIGDIAERMVESVCLVGDADLTPMAAVAGTIADSVAQRLRWLGADRAMVDNGGDIAVRMSEKEATKPLKVGLRPDVESGYISHYIDVLHPTVSLGINTSGLGGRSLTRGIASSVTVFAATSSVADAAATAVANACFVDDEAIRQVPARSLDPTTDLGDILVTAAVGAISDEKVQKALQNGLVRTNQLVAAGYIRGAVLVVKNRLCLSDDFAGKVGRLEQVA